MGEGVDDLTPVAELIAALRPWLADLVIVGGWAHRLHRLHPSASPPAYLALRTRDADVAFSPEAPLMGDIGAALKAAGFRKELSSEDTPPIAKYWLGEEDTGFFAEFLAPLKGSGKRGGVPNAPLAKAGVTAQTLRHLELLLIRPWVIRLDAAVGVQFSAPAEVRVANPVLFLAQKLLIQQQRTPAKQAQDALYIHDTLDLFARALDELRAEWRAHIRPTLPANIARRIEGLAQERFVAVTDVLRAATRIPQDRTLSPERLRAACAYGLDAIFDSR